MNKEVKKELDWAIEENLEFHNFASRIANVEEIGSSDMACLFNDIYADWRRGPYAEHHDYDAGYVSNKVYEHIEYMDAFNNIGVA